MIEQLAKRVNGIIWGMRGDMISTDKGTITCTIMGVVRLLPNSDSAPIYLGRMSDGVDKLVAAWEAV